MFRKMNIYDEEMPTFRAVRVQGCRIVVIKENTKIINVAINSKNVATKVNLKMSFYESIDRIFQKS